MNLNGVVEEELEAYMSWLHHEEIAEMQGQEEPDGLWNDDDGDAYIPREEYTKEDENGFQV